MCVGVCACASACACLCVRTCEGVILKVNNRKQRPKRVQVGHLRGQPVQLAALRQRRRSGVRGVEGMGGRRKRAKTQRWLEVSRGDGGLMTASRISSESQRALYKSDGEN